MTPTQPARSGRVRSRNIYTVKGQIRVLINVLKPRLRLCLNWTRYNLITPPGSSLEWLYLVELPVKTTKLWLQRQSAVGIKGCIQPHFKRTWKTQVGVSSNKNILLRAQAKNKPNFFTRAAQYCYWQKFWSLCARDPRVWISASCRDSRHPPPQTNTPTACKSGSATVSVWSCERCGEWDPRHRRIQTSDSWCFCLTAVGFRLTRYAAGLSC